MKSKLTALHINIIGIVSALVIAAILFFAMIKPKNEEIETTKAAVATAEGAGGTPTQVSQKKTELKRTEDEAVQTKARWTVNEEKYMDNPTAINFGTTENLPMTYYNYMTTLPATIGRWVGAWYDAQRPRGVSRYPGVEFPVEAFPANPNAISEIKYLRFPQQGVWPVALECKDFNAAMEHLTKFNGMRKHGMPVVNNVALAGQSPNLQLTYDLTLYVIPKPLAPAPDPRISSTPPGGTGTAPGGMGGMGGGSMGSMMGMGGGMSSGSMGMAPSAPASGGGTPLSSTGGRRGRDAMSGDE
jgi:hypothetical protein